MKDYYREIKPILNKLSELNVFDSLDVVRQYVKHYTSNKQIFFCRNIELPEHASINMYFSDFLIANILKYAQNSPSKKSLRQRDTRIKICSPIANINDEVNNKIIKDNKHVFTWLNSYIFNQSKIGLSNMPFILLYRYYYLYRSPNIKKYAENILGVSLGSYFKMTLYLYACFEEGNLGYSHKNLFNFQSTDDNVEALKFILNKISLPLKDIRKLCHDTCHYQGNLMFNFYSDSPHVRYPLIKENDVFYCVVPNYIIETLIVGLYFILDMPECSDYVAKKELSDNFEQYVGNIFSYYFKNTSIDFTHEITYDNEKNKDQKTSDWILWNDTHIVFLDCKLKRISIKGKGSTEIDENLIKNIIKNNYLSGTQIKNQIEDKIPAGITKDLIDLGIGLGKIFVCYDIYKQNKIDKFQYKGDKKFCAILVTLEEGFCNSPDYKEQIVNIAQAYRNYKGKTSESINSDEVKILSVRNIEYDVPITAKENSLDMFGVNNQKCINNEYLINCFEKEIMNPLCDEIKKK